MKRVTCFCPGAISAAFSPSSWRAPLIIRVGSVARFTVPSAATPPQLSFVPHVIPPSILTAGGPRATAFESRSSSSRSSCSMSSVIQSRDAADSEPYQLASALERLIGRLEQLDDPQAGDGVVGRHAIVRDA